MGSRLSRIPKEIGGEVDASEHAIPALFTFPPPSDAALDDYLAEITAEGLWLTGDKGGWVESKTKNGTKCELLKLAGSLIEAVRHTADFDADAEFVFDLYNRLNYTHIIDSFTFLVDLTEEIDLAGMKAEGFLSWAHVVWTVDRLPFPLRSIRDFVTLDLVSKRDLLLVSKSVLHPGQPVGRTPGWSSIFGGNKDSPTFRVPLMYCLKVTAKPAGGCTVTQVQWSDVGGIVPEQEIAKSVEKFGFDNMDRFTKLVANAKARKLPLGKGVEGYLANPMLPSWRQPANKMVPGIE